MPRIDVPDRCYTHEPLGSAQAQRIEQDGFDYAMEVAKGKSPASIKRATSLLRNRRKDASLSYMPTAAVFASGMIRALNERAARNA